MRNSSPGFALRLPLVLLCLPVLPAAAACSGGTTGTPDEPRSRERSQEIGSTSTPLSADGADFSFDVDFGGCSEIASLAPVPFAEARAIVPDSFTLGGDGTFAPLVVRIATCSAVSVDGHADGAGTVAQIGLSIVPPDGTGDINNYTGWYYTTSALLAARLLRIGVPAQHVEHLAFDYDRAAGTIAIDVPRPGEPRFHVSSVVVEPTAPAVPFEAIWWQLTRDGRRVKMDTPIAAIQFGSASTSLTTDPESALGRLIGGGSIASFPFLDSFNRFPIVRMHVSAR